PPFAPETFKAWIRKRGRRPGIGPRVLLWADTFNNYFMPETAQAAVNVLEQAGCEVEVLDQHLCCGRPLYDYGFLEMAKSYLRRNLEALAPHLAAGTPMVVLEPSCCSVFRDEIHGLFPESAEARVLADSTFTLSEFLEKKVPGYHPPRVNRRAIVQGHCHHKAIMRFKEEKSLMQKMGLDQRVLESGCCGMAGSFGYEKDKYEVSVACGERKLLPEVRKAGLSTIIVADGFSCKEQIAQETNRDALHLAEVLEMGLRPDTNGQTVMYPERQFVGARKAALNRSMMRAGLITLSALATDLDGLIGDFHQHGLFFGETRLLSRYRYFVDGKTPETVAVSNFEQHSWLGYYIFPPPGLIWKEDTGSGEMEAASEETVELRVSRAVGLGVHEDIDFTNFSQEPARFVFEIELDGDFA